MVELREKIAEKLAALRDTGFPASAYLDDADAILDIPELRAALETAANLRANHERKNRLRLDSISVEKL